jgi:hypothetical protein
MVTRKSRNMKQRRMTLAKAFQFAELEHLEATLGGQAC